MAEPFTQVDKVLDKAMIPEKDLNAVQESKVSFFDMLPDAVKAKVLEIPASILTTTEEDLKERVHLSSKDYYVKAGFWLTYDEAISSGKRKISMDGLLMFMPWQLFNQRFLENHMRLAWLILPPPTYDVQLTAMYAIANERLLDVLDPPPGWKQLKDAVGWGQLMLRAWKEIDIKKHGPAIHRIESKNVNTTKQVNINIDMDKKDAKKLLTLAEIDKQIEDLKNKMKLNPDEGHDVGDGEGDEREVTPRETTGVESS